MKTKQNLHIHTTYVDGKDSPEEIIKAAGFSTPFILTSNGFKEETL